MKKPSDHIWAYLHNELNDEEKNSFLQALSEDPKLNDTFRHCSKTHRELQEILPELESEEPLESIEKKLLAEWEADHPEHAGSPCPNGRRILTFGAPLAVAAALVILLSLPAANTPIRWQRSAYGTAPQLRGQAAGTPYYSRDELEQVDRILRTSIETAYEELTDSPESWKLQIHLQEVAGGALLAEVSGQSRSESETVRIWSENFPGENFVRQKAELFAERIAADLAEQTE